MVNIADQVVQKFQPTKFFSWRLIFVGRLDKNKSASFHPFDA